MPQQDVAAPLLGKYGYGFFEVTQNGKRYYGHGGGAPGMNGELRVFPSSRYVIAQSSLTLVRLLRQKSRTSPGRSYPIGNIRVR